MALDQKNDSSQATNNEQKVTEVNKNRSDQSANNPIFPEPKKDAEEALQKANIALGADKANLRELQKQRNETGMIDWMFGTTAAQDKEIENTKKQEARDADRVKNFESLVGDLKELEKLQQKKQEGSLGAEEQKKLDELQAKVEKSAKELGLNESPQARQQKQREELSHQQAQLQSSRQDLDAAAGRLHVAKVGTEIVRDGAVVTGAIVATIAAAPVVASAALGMGVQGTVGAAAVATAAAKTAAATATAAAATAAATGTAAATAAATTAAAAAETAVATAAAAVATGVTIPGALISAAGTTTVGVVLEGVAATAINAAGAASDMLNNDKSLKDVSSEYGKQFGADMRKVEAISAATGVGIATGAYLAGATLTPASGFIAKTAVGALGGSAATETGFVVNTAQQYLDTVNEFNAQYKDKTVSPEQMARNWKDFCGQRGLDAESLAKGALQSAGFGLGGAVIGVAGAEVQGALSSQLGKGLAFAGEQLANLGLMASPTAYLFSQGTISGEEFAKMTGENLAMVMSANVVGKVTHQEAAAPQEQIRALAIAEGRSQLGTLADGTPVWTRKGANHLANHKGIEELLPEIFEKLDMSQFKGQNLGVELDLGRPVGISGCVRVNPGYEVVYARRAGREDSSTRFVMGQEGEPCNIVTAHLYKNDPGVVSLSTAYVGRKAPPEPGSRTALKNPELGAKAQQFWREHALVWDGEVDPLYGVHPEDPSYWGPDPVTGKLTTVHSLEVNKAVETAKATMPDYWAKTLAQRAGLSGEAQGSIYPNMTPEQLEATIAAAPWEPYQHPAVMEGCKAYKAQIPGKLGIVDLKTLPDETPVKLDDMKEVGKVNAVVGGVARPDADFSVLITGRENPTDQYGVWTLHPGEPVRPSQVNAEGLHGKIVTAKEAWGMGLEIAKISDEPIAPVVADTQTNPVLEKAIPAPQKGRMPYRGYYALELTPESIEQLKAMATLPNATVVSHHMTVRFGTDSPSDLPQAFTPEDVGKTFQLKVLGQATRADNGIQAAAVGLMRGNETLTDGISANKIPHITLALNKDLAKPVESNALLEGGYDPTSDGMVLTAVLKHVK